MVISYSPPGPLSRGGDQLLSPRAITAGSLVPLAMFALWEAVFTGLVPAAGPGAKDQFIQALAASGG